MAAGVSTNNMIEQHEEAAEKETAFPEEATLHINKGSNPEDKPCVKISSLSNKNIQLDALIDTGSPVSLIRYSIYKKHFSCKELFRVKNTVNLRGVNNSVINIIEKIHDEIILDNLNDSWLDIELLIVEDHTIKYDIVQYC